MLGRLAVYAIIAVLSLGLSFLIVVRSRGADVGNAPPGAAAAPNGPPARDEVARAAEPSAPAEERAATAAPDAGAAGSAGPAEPDPRSEALCPERMIYVEGTTCGAATRPCERRDPSSREICAVHAPARCAGGAALSFCIDRHEYPNLPGVLPATLIPFESAARACEEEGKRLCGEMEWMFACEGPAALAYSYGDGRRAGVCNVDRAAPDVRPSELWEPRDIGPALARVDGRAASGASPGCVSPFGMEDALGNVEEWVRSDVPGVRAALRGGSFSTPGATCRSVRVMESPGFRQVHTGFRCCRDPLVRPRARG